MNYKPTNKFHQPYDQTISKPLSQAFLSVVVELPSRKDIKFKLSTTSEQCLFTNNLKTPYPSVTLAIEDNSYNQAHKIFLVFET